MEIINNYTALLYILMASIIVNIIQFIIIISILRNKKKEEKEINEKKINTDFITLTSKKSIS